MLRRRKPSSNNGTELRSVVRRVFAGIAILLVPGCLLLPGSQAADTASAYELTVRPRICVRLESDSVCNMQLSVSWTAPQLADVCLKLQDGESALECWQQQRAGETVITLARSSNAVLQLLTQEDNVVLNETEISVVSRDLRDSRRRRRHAWSIL